MKARIKALVFLPFVVVAYPILVLYLGRHTFKEAFSEGHGEWKYVADVILHVIKNGLVPYRDNTGRGTAGEEE